VDILARGTQAGAGGVGGCRDHACLYLRIKRDARERLYLASTKTL
jgi:hypothetical protein